MRILRIITICFFCLLGLLVPDKSYGYILNDFTFSNLNYRSGLCNQRIFSVATTSDGALWWASKTCIERYNGVKIKHYDDLASQKKGNGAVNSYSLSLHGDDLYAFDNQGAVYKYNKDNDKFELLADISALLKKDVLLSDVLPTDDSFIFSLREGAYLYLPETSSLLPILQGPYTNTTVKCRNNYLFCTNKGLFSVPCRLLTPKNGNLPGLKPKHLSDNVFASAYYDKVYNCCWLGGFDCGLSVLCFNASGKPEIKKIDGSPLNPIRAFCPYDKNTMLVGVDGYGVYQVDRRTFACSMLFTSTEGPNGILHGNGVYSIVKDKWGDIVVGTYSGGLDIARPIGSTVAVFEHIRQNAHSIINDHVNTVRQFDASTLMMGTDDGISILTIGSQQWRHICRGYVVLDIEKAQGGNGYLVATYGNGVLSVSNDGSVKPLYTVANHALLDDHVYSLFYDRHGNLWMGTLGGKLVMRSAGGIFRYYQVNNVQNIIELPDGRIAVATASGIQTVNPVTGKVAELDYQTDNGSVSCHYVLNLFVFKSDLYIATDGGGVYVYNLKSHRCRQISTQNGLPSNTACSLTTDGNGRIFIATSRGLAFVDTRHPGNAVCANYCYGLDREYIRSAACNLSDGMIAFGTASGCLIVNPRYIRKLDYTARLNILAPETLKLPYSGRTFDLEFECINLRNQYDIVYVYRIGNGEWSSPSGEQHIRFENLEQGSHELTIRAVSRTCGEVLDERTMEIVIQAPWWNSWWMWIIYLLLLAGAFYAAWKVYELHDKYMRLVSQLSSLNRVESPKLSAESADSIESKESKEGEEEGNAFVNTATQLVLEHISDADFNIDSLCREMAMSRTMFYLKLKSYTGKSPQDFLRIIRLERAASLLRSGKSVMEVSVAVGFDNVKYFSTVFKKYFGVSPSKYE